MSYLLTIALLLAALPCRAQIAAPLPGCLMWITFEDGNMNDHAGTYNCANSNGVVFVGGRFGMAGSFNGSNSYANVGPYNSNTQLLNSGSNWTWSVWILYSANTAGEILISGRLGTRFAVLKVFDNTHIGWINSAGGSGTSYSTPLIGNGQWHNITVITVPWSNNKLAYIDGVLQSFTMSGDSTPIATSFYIGGEAAGVGYCFNGLIENVQVYGRILSDSEIATLANFKPWGNQ